MPDVTVTQLAIGVGAAIAVGAYLALIVAPAWASYGRLWERVAASFLTLYTLAALVGIGAVVGVAIVWFYDRFG